MSAEHTPPDWTPLVVQLEAMDRRLDAIHERAVEIGRIAATALLGRIVSDPRYDDPLRLERHGYKVYSQSDEDGILAEVFRRIGTTDRRFLEFGVENGLENNTRCLLEQQWSGAWLEGHPGHVSDVETGFGDRIANGRLTVREVIVDRDNINDLIRALALPRDLDLLSIDIDGNDYHVWEAITVVEPRVVVVEYNAKFRPPMRWVMDYEPTHRWDGTDRFGASLETLTDLGRQKGYRLVGCSIAGTNAFFVRSGLAERGFASPPDAAPLYHPARYFLLPAFVSGHPASYGRGSAGR